ncbi:hypothetical protein HYALB_00008141 [Hymenoscyphus albidus]|uniref:Uncharacterized protein n=1 Tax=Hymenoscyphus albidus TaxID=595503 RepID=A0A9N9Q3H6_9HELO|nr:hypothetical protein HYALB_00008141 [Hymenoscyphus albidus]
MAVLEMLKIKPCPVLHWVRYEYCGCFYRSFWRLGRDPLCKTKFFFEHDKCPMCRKTEEHTPEHIHPGSVIKTEASPPSHTTSPNALQSDEDRENAREASIRARGGPFWLDYNGRPLSCSRGDQAVILNLEEGVFIHQFSVRRNSSWRKDPAYTRPYGPRNLPCGNLDVPLIFDVNLPEGLIR